LAVRERALFFAGFCWLMGILVFLAMGK
jgi:hypothetical protein